MTELVKIMQQRHSCREFLDKAVENEKIDTGYEKLNNSLKEARACHISESNELYKAIDSSSKQGFCHYLANENRVKWVNNDK